MKHLLSGPARLARTLLVVALAAPAVASADIPITTFKASPVPAFNTGTGLPVTPQAPNNPALNDINCNHVAGLPPTQFATAVSPTTDYCISFTTNPGDAITGEDIHDTLVGLPVGTQALIDNAAKCSEAAFNRESPAGNTCPGESQVGTALAQLQTPAAPNPAVDRAVQQSPGRIYALDTPADKAAKFGVALIAAAPTATTPLVETKFTITVSQLGNPKIGLQNQTDELKKTVASAAFPGGQAPIAIQANSLRFWGSADAHPHVSNPFAQQQTAPVKMASDFFIVGTTCATDQTVNLTINPYTDTPTNAASKPTTASTTYKLTGCDNLPFNPGFEAQLTDGGTVAGFPGLKLKITSPQGNEDLGGTKITLPQGVATNLDRASNSCPQATFEADGCGSGTIVGKVRAVLSGIGADVISGDVHIVKVEGKNLPALGFDFNGRLPLRIAGITEVGANNRIVNTFSDLPSIPQRELDVELFGGAGGILQVAANQKCSGSSLDATITGQNGKTKQFSTARPCPAQLTARLDNSDLRVPRLTIGGAGATGKKISTLRLTLPAGLTINRNRSQSGIKVKNLEAAATGDTKRSRLSKKQIRFTLPKAGSNGLSILTKTGTLAASAAFAKRENAITLQARIVYTDGTKVNVDVPITRKESS